MAKLPDFEELAMFANVATVRSLALAAQAARSRHRSAAELQLP